MAHMLGLVDKNSYYSWIPYVEEARRKIEHVREMKAIKSQSNICRLNLQYEMKNTLDGINSIMSIAE